MLVLPKAAKGLGDVGDGGRRRKGKMSVTDRGQ